MVKSTSSFVPPSQGVEFGPGISGEFAIGNEKIRVPQWSGVVATRAEVNSSRSPVDTFIEEAPRTEERMLALQNARWKAE
jgi:hypothetical protein